jgi:hypothetical protein
VRFRSVVVIGWWMGRMLLAVVRGATAQVDPVAVQGVCSEYV